MLIFTTEKLVSVLVLNFLAAFAELRGLKWGSISDPASLRGSCVRTARTARTSRPQVPEGMACSICALALKKNVAERRSVA